jgi:hypothetical protein
MPESPELIIARITAQSGTELRKVKVTTADERDRTLPMHSPRRGALFGLQLMVVDGSLWYGYVPREGDALATVKAFHNPHGDMSSEVSFEGRGGFIELGPACTNLEISATNKQAIGEITHPLGRLTLMGRGHFLAMPLQQG